MLRLEFEKTGNAVWMSHLDLMRVFQRAFRRAGMLLKHSQGYTPHAFVSIVLPLSVGVESCCELLDFALADEAPVPTCEIAERLNAVLPDGVRVHEVWENGRKIKELTHLRVCLTLCYDRGVPQGCAEALLALLARETLPVARQKKQEITTVDIRPMISDVSVTQTDGQTLALRAVICAQNPSLNPQLILQAIQRYLPELAPDFARCAREAALDAGGAEFR